MEAIVSDVRKTFRSGKTKQIEFRRRQLKSFLRFFNENADDIIEALQQDLRKHKQETITMEIVLVKNEIKEMLSNLREWSNTKYPPKSFVNWLDGVYVINEPYGVVLVMGAWNYPLQLLLLPVVGAIAAGNCVIIKPSEVAPAIAKYLEMKLPQYLDSNCYRVVNGGIPETTELLQEKFDYIFYTGSTKVGRIIHAAANKNLTPVTLELGGKSPVYIDETANFKVALKRLLWGKFVNLGQTCIAPDYILCNQKVQKIILEMAPKIIEKFYGSNPQNSPDLARIVNDAHFKRIVRLLQSGKVAFGGHVDSKDRYISPTILIDVDPDEPIMQEEIFGPILPIVTIDSVEDTIEFVNNRRRPLALYIFSTRYADVWNIINNTSCGGVCVNDTIMHFVADNLPFGGVGMSGMGNYHGKYSFDTFTHKKSCLYKDYNLIGENLACARYPPYSEGKIKFLTSLISRRPEIPLPSFSQIIAFGCGIVVMCLLRLIEKTSEVY